MSRPPPQLPSTIGRWLRPARTTLIALVTVHGLASALVLYTPITEWLALPLLIPRQRVEPSDAIVVLGAWATATGDLNESGLRRTIQAADLYRDGAAPVVVVTGSPVTEPGSGSAVEAMASLLSRLGIPDSALVLDRQSANTHASAVTIAALAQKTGWRRVILVTDAAHQPRGTRSFRKAGLEATPVSAASVWDLGAAQPSARARRVGVLAHEYGGLLYYWYRGWI
jgi:uncharacterized SAM-binding protein YcdF (DUF218 family)